MIRIALWTWMLASGWAAEPDLDGDGWPAATDCDDADATVNPDADESCNEIDDDCDGLVDDNDDDERVIGSSWAWFDGDGDHLGSGVYDSFCVRPRGWVRPSGDCDDTDPTIGGLITLHPDDDGDGYGWDASTRGSCVVPTGYVVEGGDCDDADATLNPGMDEVCNGIDDNCDELIDESDPLFVGTTFYEDADHDGYGDDATTDSSGCEPLAHYVELGGDCDVAEIATHPGAVELCDGEDNDCDTEIDESVMDVDWYVDADADGFGEASDVVSDCAQPAGYAYTADDCDDGDASVSPVADETCGNWIDDDCDGARDECTVTAEDVSDFVVTATLAGTGFGKALATGDANGDGWGDLVVGAPYWDSTGRDPNGAAFVFRGPLTGAATTDAAAFVVTGTTDWATLGESVALGDADGDGNGYLVVGASGTGLAGAAYLFHGPLTGSADVSDADASFGSRTLYKTAAGRSVLIVPDHTGDGVSDLLVGSPGYDFRGGTVFVFSGALTGARDVISDSACAYHNEENHDRTGSSVEALGDQNGDGLEDILIGAPYQRRAYVVEGGEPRGRHYLPDVAAAVLDGRGGLAVQFGTDVAAGDLDGDGYADAVISAPYPFDPAPENGGGVYAFLGPLTGRIGPHDAVARWVGDGGRSSGFGFSVATGSDVDGDGTTDVVLGDPSDENLPRGTVYLQLGPASGVIDDSMLTSFRSSELDELGWDVAFAPDWTGDGLPEIAAGAPGTTGETGVAGSSVSVFFSDSLFD